MSRGALVVVVAAMLVALVAFAHAGSRAAFNSDGVLVIDGKKTFPIGFTMRGWR